MERIEINELLKKVKLTNSKIEKILLTERSDKIDKMFFQFFKDFKIEFLEGEEEFGHTLYLDDLIFKRKAYFQPPNRDPEDDIVDIEKIWEDWLNIDDISARVINRKSKYRIFYKNNILILQINIVGYHNFEIYFKIKDECLIEILTVFINDINAKFKQLCQIVYDEEQDNLKKKRIDEIGKELLKLEVS